MLLMEALLLDKSSGVLRKDFAQWRMPTLALEANAEMWFPSERSWLIVRPKSFSD